MCCLPQHFPQAVSSRPRAKVAAVIKRMLFFIMLLLFHSEKQDSLFLLSVLHSLSKIEFFVETGKVS